jgi:sporulation protein YlmC with PRC-barrel domain
MKIPSILSAGSMIGTKVHNLEGESIGEIKEIMIDHINGRIAYAVLSFGGFLGVGNKLFAIPFEAIDFDTYPDTGGYALDLDKEELEEAPGFDKDEWPKHASTEFMTLIYSHYGIDPYWEPNDRTITPKM